MSRRDANHRRHLLPLAALVLLAALTGVPAVSAETSGDVTVTASVTNSHLSMTLCDETANFGLGLDSTGTPPTDIDSTDLVVATNEAYDDSRKGVFYRWTPSCQVDGSGNFLTVESNIFWTFQMCVGENTGSNEDLSGHDLYWDQGGTLLEYDRVETFAISFPSCDSYFWTGGTGNRSLPMYYYLRIDDHVGDGTFEATTTIEVVP